MEDPKKVFSFSRPWWKKAWNRTDYTTRVSGLLIISILFTFRNVIKDGYNNGRLHEMKQKWIRATASDSTSEGTYLSHLDEEEPPSPLPKRTALDQFRAEFAKIKTNVTDSYK